MKKVLKSNIGAGSRESHEPRLAGSIVAEMLHGNSPLAVGYRQYIASLEKEDDEEQDWHANTDFGCDVKTLLRSDKRMVAGKEYPGIFRCDSDAIIDEFLYRDPHFTFVETLPQRTCKRNPRLFDGRYISVTRRDDGSLNLNFKKLDIGEDFSIERFALAVYREICLALEGLLGE